MHRPLQRGEGSRGGGIFALGQDLESGGTLNGLLPVDMPVFVMPRRAAPIGGQVTWRPRRAHW